MSAFVVYEVSVLVEVDEHARTIVSVRVEDEAVRGPVDAVELAAGLLTDRRRQRLFEIAESTSWPSWQFGFA